MTEMMMKPETSIRMHQRQTPAPMRASAPRRGGWASSVRMAGATSRAASPTSPFSKAASQMVGG